MNSLVAFCTRTIATALLLFTTLVAAQNVPNAEFNLSNEHARAWQDPLTIRLPVASRTVLLQANVDAGQWLQRHKIVASRSLPMGGQTLLQFAMTDTEWAAQQSAICGSSDVVECPLALCQAIQLKSELAQDPDAANTTRKIKARVVRKQPEVGEDKALGAAGDLCRAPMAAALTEPGSGLQLDLDLRGLVNSDGSKSESVKPFGPASLQEPGTASSDSQLGIDGKRPAAAAQSVPFQLLLSESVNGSAGFDSAYLPADTTDYDLLVGEGCRQVRIPLETIEPAHVPNVLVAFVNSTDVDSVATDFGLAVVESVELKSAGENLVIYATSNLLSGLALLASDPRVRSAQREYVYTTSATRVAPVYSDTYAGLTYGPAQTGASALHGATQGASQTVAVIDTGVAVDHPELAGRVESADFTGQGWSADAHGTAVAGIIAATANNAQGAYGVAPSTNILALKACQPVAQDSLRAKCRSSSLAKALDAALLRDVDIINMSLAGPPDALLAKFVALAISRNKLVVAGAGNGGSHAKPAFPAALPNVLAVTAVDIDKTEYAEANRGTYIDVAAPGVDIVTPFPGGTYPASSGTSWAAAHVSGVAALIRDLAPLLTAGEVRSILLGQAQDLGQPGPDAVFGRGLIDACLAAAVATADGVRCTTSREAPANDYVN